ncbi:MAG: YihY/virulence factor BrkB family protein [Caldilinea sp. CFX5]|nr:YihY/virulence factor BrkB family protein [Caldilinea sp. CFX5]
MNLREIWNLLKATYTQWSNDEANQLAAALAFYTTISIAPLLVLVIAIVGLFLGEQAAQGQLQSQLEDLMGEQAAQFAQTAIASTARPAVSSIASLLSLGVLLWGSTNVFTQLQNSLNAIWNVEPKPGRGVMGIVQDRLLSFGMVLGIGFLLLLSLLLSSILSAVASSFSQLLPGIPWLWQLLNFLVALAVTSLLFGLIFKVLPDIKIAWKDVWIGGLITAILFTIGQFALSLYLGNQGSAYGVAGSVVVFLLWVYYSAQILFFGAEFTQVYAGRYGQGVEPTENAVVKPRKATPEGQSAT